MDVNQFPVFKTKVDGVTKKFNLNDPQQRKEYFEAKAGPEIAIIREFLKDKTFVGYLVGKKNTGKGTYSKLFMEVFGSDRVGHVAVGDIVRDVHKGLETEEGKKEFGRFMEKNFRGFHSVDEIEALIFNRNTISLISSELIVALLKYEISKRDKKAIFIDGFPRAFDQMGYAIFLKELIGYRDDPDFLAFIDVPEPILDARIKSRVICPKCNTPRSVDLFPTKTIGFSEKENMFYLICDNAECGGARMVPKEGDELGIEPIRSRLETDGEISAQLQKLTGIPKVYLRNSVPVDVAKDTVDDYEITPMYRYKRNVDSGAIEVLEEPWIINDDQGVPSYSLLPAAVALGFIKQVAKVLS